MKLNPGQNDAASVTASAEDTRGQIHPLAVEFAADIPGFPWLYADCREIESFDDVSKRCKDQDHPVGYYK